MMFTMSSSDSVGLEMGVVVVVRGVGVIWTPPRELAIEDREWRLEGLLGFGEAEGAGVKYIAVLERSQEEPMYKAMMIANVVVWRYKRCGKDILVTPKFPADTCYYYFIQAVQY